MSSDVYDFRKFEDVVEKEFSKLQRHLVAEHRHQVEKILTDVATSMANSIEGMGGSRPTSRSAWTDILEKPSQETSTASGRRRSGEDTFSPNSEETRSPNIETPLDVDVELSKLERQPNAPIVLNGAENSEQPKSLQSKAPLLIAGESEAAKGFRQRRKSKTIDLAEVLVFKPPDSAAQQPAFRLNLVRPQEESAKSASIALPSSPPPELTVVDAEEPPPGRQKSDSTDDTAPLSVQSVATQRLSGLSESQKQRIDAIRRASNNNSPNPQTDEQEAKSPDTEGSDGSQDGSDDSAKKKNSDGEESDKESIVENKQKWLSDGTSMQAEGGRGQRVSLMIPQKAPSALRNSRQRESVAMLRTSKRSITLGGGGPGEMNSLESVMAQSRTSILSRSGSMGGGGRLLMASGGALQRKLSIRSLRISERDGEDSPVGRRSLRESWGDETRRPTRSNSIKLRASQSMENLTDLSGQENGVTGRSSMTEKGRRDSTDSANSCSSMATSQPDHCYEVLQIWRPKQRRTRTMNRKELLGLNNQSNVFESVEDKDSEEEEPQKKFMIPPGSAQHIAWDVVGFLFIAYDIIFIPLEWFDPPTHWFTTFIAWLVRCYWTFAIPVYFFIGYIDDQGDVQMRPKKVAKRYVTTWFGMDIMLVILDWLEVFVNSGSSALRFTSTLRSLRILRTVRLLRVLKAPLVWRYITEQIRSEELILVAHICKIMTSMLVVVHVLACAWYGIGAAYRGTPNWIEAPGSNVHFESLANRYFLSVHWSLSAFAGETLIDSQNLAERVYTIWTLFSTFMLAASLVSSITTAMTRLEIMSRQQSWQLMQLRRYLVDHHISHKLKVRVQRNAQHVMLEQKRNMPESGVSLLSVISEPLLVELHFEVRSIPLMDHPFFCCLNDISPSGIRKVCHTAVSVLSLSSGDVLFSDGDVPIQPAMFFTTSGRIRYKQEAGDAVNVIVEIGQWLCEGVLWTHWTHHGTLRAETESRLLAIDAEKFQGICSATPMVQMQRYAEAYVEVLNMIEKDDVTDLGFFDEHLEDMIAFSFPELVYEQELDKPDDDDDDPSGLGYFRSGDHTSRTSGGPSGSPSERTSFNVAVERISEALGFTQRNSTGDKTNGLHARLKKGNTNNNLNHILRSHKRTHQRKILDGFKECVCFPCTALLFCLRKCCKHRRGSIPRHWSQLFPSSPTSRRPAATGSNSELGGNNFTGRRPSTLSFNGEGARSSSTTFSQHLEAQGRRISNASTQGHSLGNRGPSTTSVSDSRPSVGSVSGNQQQGRRTSNASVTLLKPVEESQNRHSMLSAVSDFDMSQALADESQAISQTMSIALNSVPINDFRRD